MFCDITEKMSQPILRQLLSGCLGDRSPKGIDAALRKYPGEIFYGWMEYGEPLGMCGFCVLPDKLEICHIAVAETARNEGIGTAMVFALREKYNKTIEAETDDNAIGFYRKCGFQVTELYKEYDGQKYRRWRCVLEKPFWNALDRLVAESKIVIDRPKGSQHPKYPSFIYPLDYGYLDGTTSMDGGGIDVWKGTNGEDVDAIICIVDLLKRDSEIKILIGCSEDEKQTALKAHNNSENMKGILIAR